MRFNVVSILFMLGAAIGVNAACRDGDSFCGDCNGTSCKVAGLNYDCAAGTSCVGNGGGDGAYCGSTTGYLQGPYNCPVKT
ncbi:hypothetical protein BFW01_g1490 [Lasiodiplodia theobromae]|nr:hypothetical protein BFW01_g1490 [Lasiodiplodia theobromae]